MALLLPIRSLPAILLVVVPLEALPSGMPVIARAVSDMGEAARRAAAHIRNGGGQDGGRFKRGEEVKQIFLLACAIVLAACSDPFAAAPVRDYMAVTTGGEHTCALASDGSAYCWGRGADGELGNGGTDNQYTPAKVATDVKFKAIAAGDAHTCALSNDGQPYCWGWNAYFQTGVTQPVDLKVPQPVETPVRFTKIVAGSFHTCGIAVDKQVYCWGYNRYGQNGNGKTTTTVPPEPVAGGFRADSISAGRFHTCALTSSGAAYCWGRNEYNQLGVGTDVLASTSPLPVTTTLRFAQIDAGATHTCAVSTSGARVYCWGSNVHGEIGDGTAFKEGLPASATPTPSSNMINMKFVSAGVFHTCAVALDGAISCWGRGEFGQLAIGDTHDQYYPQRVYLQPLMGHGADRLHLSSIAADGFMHDCGVGEHAIFCWGSGPSGQLGGGSQTAAGLPMRVND